MSKVVALAVCGVFAATAVFAQTNVLSQNAVGYVKVSMAADELKLVTHQFNDIDGNPQTPSTVVGDQLPFDSQLFTWNGLGYDIDDYLAGGKAIPTGWQADTAAIEPGVGFFLKAAGAADVFLLGEVPADATIDLTAEVGLTALGFPYPASQAWTGTLTAANAVVGDQFFTWNGTGYDIADNLLGAKAIPPGWSNKDKVLPPGEGWFYNSQLVAPRTESEVKPYAWP